MKVYTLIDDNKQINSAFVTEHGLSLYFEHEGKRILFDTGETDAFIYNATLLGIDLNKIDACVISHAHDDHTGGLTHFLNINRHAPVYLKRAVQSDYYSRDAGHNERIGLDPEFYRQHTDRLRFFDGHIEIAQGVTAASINTYRKLPLHTSLLLEKQGDLFVRDTLDHELYLAIQTGNGVVVLIGCAHHGVLNTLMSAEQQFGKVSGVIGGFHLNGLGKYNFKKEPDSKIQAIARYIDDHKIRKVYAGHCTGAKPLEKLSLLARVKKMHAGDIIEI